MGRGFNRSKRSRLRSNDGSMPRELHPDMAQSVLDIRRVEVHHELLGELVVLDAHHQSARPFQVPELPRILEESEADSVVGGPRCSCSSSSRSPGR